MHEHASASPHERRTRREQHSAGQAEVVGEREDVFGDAVEHSGA
jgi:hypothetical protein